MKKSSSFALIYTLLFIILLLIAVSVTWFTGLADIRLARRTEYSTAAMQLAKSAIDEGWVKYKDDLLRTIYPLPNDAALTFPTGACNTTNANYFRNWPDRPAPTPTPTSKPLSPAPSLADTLIGVYDYKICTSGGATTIEGIGYYKGNKITLKADVNHDGDTEYCSGGTGGSTQPECEAAGGTWKLNHSNDYLTIYQTGPSK